MADKISDNDVHWTHNHDGSFTIYLNLYPDLLAAAGTNLEELSYAADRAQESYSKGAEDKHEAALSTVLGLLSTALYQASCE